MSAIPVARRSAIPAARRSAIPRERFGKALPGCERILRFYDTRHAMILARVAPGEYYVTNSANEGIVTTLGSCVSACIRDPALQLGGLNHFMLPGTSGQAQASVVNNIYGVAAMETLINEILKLGGRRSELEIKVTGGGRIGSGSARISESNASFVLRFLDTEGFKPVAVDLGGDQPRKVLYEPATGRLRIKRLESVRCEDAISLEDAYIKSVAGGVTAGTVELF